MRSPGTIPIATTPEPRIWIITASGKMSPITETCGFRTSRKAGLLIAMATGFTSLTTAGLGSAMNRGAGHRITTGVGSRTEADGPGGLDRCTPAITRSGRRLTCRSGDGAGALASAGAALAGCQSGLAIGSTRGGVVSAEGSAHSTTTVSTMTVSIVTVLVTAA